MTLPVSRNNTYSDASPVRSADLNDLQDCIIAGKHGLISHSLKGALFVGANSDITLSGLGRSCTSGAGCVLISDLGVKHGSFITNVEVDIVFTGPTQATFQVWLYQFSGVSSIAPIGDVHSSSTGITVIPVDVAVPDNWTAILRVYLQNIGDALMGARVAYRKP